MGARIYRYEVPVDDQWHEHALSGTPLAVGCRDLTVVEFWAWHDNRIEPRARRFRVFGTGHPVPDNTVYCGTAVAPGGRLVWHLVEES